MIHILLYKIRPIPWRWSILRLCCVNKFSANMKSSWRCWRWWWGWEWMTCWKWPRLVDKGISWWSDPMIWGFLFYEIPLSTLFGCWLLCLSVTIHLAPHGINAFSLLDKMFNIYCIGVLMQNMNLSHLNIPLIDSKIFKKWRWVKGHQQFVSFL